MVSAEEASPGCSVKAAIRKMTRTAGIIEMIFAT